MASSKKIEFNAGATVTLLWTEFKSAALAKKISIQYFDSNKIYNIFALDGNSVVYKCFIYKDGYSAQAVYEADYSQAQNDIDRDDFESNYLAEANVPLGIGTYKSKFNSTEEPLVANAMFQGIGEDVASVVSIDVTIITDQVSAVNGFIVEWSQDNIRFDYAENFTIKSNIGQFFSFAPRAKFFRLTYINGLVDQTNLVISTFYYQTNRSSYVQSLATDVPVDKSVDVVRSVIAAQKPGAKNNPYTNLQATLAGSLKVAVDTAVYPPAGIAIVVQKKHSGPTIGQNIYTAFNSNVTKGNTIIAVVQQIGGFATSYILSDSQSNLYTRTGTVNVPGVGRTELWAANSAGGPCGVSAASFSSTVTISLQIYEVSGLAVSGNLIDNITASFSATTTSFSVGPVVTTQNGDFCVAAYVGDGYSVISPGVGWTADFSDNSVGCFSQVASIAGSITGTATSTTPINCLAVIVTFLPAVVSKSILTDVDGRLLVKSQLQTDDGYSIVLGQGTETTSLPVVIASDQSAIPVLQSGTWTVEQGTPPWSVVGNKSTNTIIPGSTNIGVLPAIVASGTPSLTDGYQTALSTDLTGNLRVTLASTSANPDKAAFTYGVTNDTVVGGVYQDTSPTLTAGQSGAVRLTINRAFQVNLRDAAGNEKLAQQTMANSIPAVIASDQSKIPVHGPDAVGGSPVGNPVLIGAKDPSGNVITALAIADGALRNAADPHQQIIHNNATITSTGSIVLTSQGWSGWFLLINLKNAPTGTTPTITFKVESIDPVDQTTVVAIHETGLTHTTAGIESINVHSIDSSVIKISWIVTGTTPSWTGVNATWVGHSAGGAAVGPTPVGSPPTEPPVTVGGVGPSGNITNLLTDSSGNLQVVLNTVSSQANVGLVQGTVALGGGTSGTSQVVRATTYNEQTTAAQRSIKSANANDTSAGTGAREVTITYFDASLNGPFTEIITMNGTTAVVTTNTDICFIEKMEVTKIGSGMTNAGIITLYVGTGGTGTVIGTIGTGSLVSGTGDGKTLWSHHYIPAGKTASLATVVVGLSTGTGSTQGNAYLTSQKVLVANSANIIVGDLIATGTGAAVVRQLGVPLRIVGPARATGYFVPSSNNCTIVFSFDFSELPTT